METNWKHYRPRIKRILKRASLSIIIVLGICALTLYFKTPSRPNVVLIIIDTLRADKLGCYGFPKDISPEIDNISKNGVQFNNVIAQSSWTRPSIASMLTSRYPRSLGIYREKFNLLNTRYKTLARILKGNGYTTFGITANPNINKLFNFNIGFDKYIDSHVIWRWMKPEEGKVGFASQNIIERKYFKDNELLSKLLKEKIITKSENTSFELISFDYKIKTKEQLKERLHKIGISQVNPILSIWQKAQGKYPPTRSKRIFKRLLNIIRNTKSKGPFYAQINIMEMHNPWSMLRKEFKKNFLNLDKFPWYHDAVKQVSYDVNKFIEKITKIPGWENTLFIITSDHGEGLDSHPSVSNSTLHGELLYKSQLKVPMILYYPQSKYKKFVNWFRGLTPQENYLMESKKIKQPVRLLDLMPTILDYLKITVPSNIDGKSLLPLIYETKTKLDLPKYFISEATFRNSNKISVYSGKWEYIENRDGHKGVNKYELQPIGIIENGKITDKIDKEKEVSVVMRKFLEVWEKQYPKIKATNVKNKISKKELIQLKSLGYL